MQHPTSTIDNLRPTSCQALLLRVWRANDDELSWSATLEDVYTGVNVQFSRTETLIEHLNRLLAQPQKA